MEAEEVTTNTVGAVQFTSKSAEDADTNWGQVSPNWIIWTSVNAAQKHASWTKNVQYQLM